MKNAKRKDVAETAATKAEEILELASEISWLAKTGKKMNSKKMRGLFVGAAVVFVPGAIPMLAAYKKGKKIIKAYDEFKTTDAGKRVSFVEWFNEAANEKIKKKGAALLKARDECIKRAVKKLGGK